MGRRLLANLLTVLGLCVAASAATAPRTPAVDKQEAADSGNQGRLLRRRAAAQRTRETQDVHLGEGVPWEGQQSDTQLGGQNLCKSIIAVGGWKRDRETRFGIEFTKGGPDDDIEFVEDDNVIIPFESDHLRGIDTEEEFVCEMQDGMTLPIQGTEEQITELRMLLNNGTLISAQSSVEVDYVGISAGVGTGTEGIAAMPGDGKDGIPEFVALPLGSIRVIDNKEDEYSRRRRLNMYKGVKKVLVVKVTDNGGRAVPEDAAFISDKWFGTSGDTVTPMSGFEGCSHGKMQISNDYGGAIDESRLSAPGVLEVNINVNLRTSSQSVIRNKAAAAVQQKLQLLLPGPFDHVCFVVEKCYGSGCGFSAYAFVQHWFSLYVLQNWKYPAVVMHELGHNLNFAHSGGMNGRTYTDHTCLMGNPLWKDNVGRMCFNPVKNYQLAKAGNSWYSDKHIKVFDSGIIGGTSWSGRIIGVAEYDNNEANLPIVVKLETGRGSDFFLGFNRAVGPNAHNKQADDRVTLYTVAAGDGSKYSNSFLKAALRSQQRATIRDWRETGQDLVINVYEINTSASLGYADITIEFGPQATLSPSKVPTNSPTTSIPTTEPTESPTALPTVGPTSGPSHSPSRLSSSTPTTSGVVFFDSGTGGSTSWAGALVGTSESPSINLPHTIVLEWDHDTRWFVQYNSAHQVTVFKWADGEVSLEGLLDAGQNETVPNWRNSTLDLVILVQSIDTNASPSFASVEIVFASQTASLSPTAGPTRDPTLPPTMSPTRAPSTATPTAPPSKSPTLSPTVPPTAPPMDILDQTPPNHNNTESTTSTLRDKMFYFDSGTTGGTSWTGTLSVIGEPTRGSSNPTNTLVLGNDEELRYVQFNGESVGIFGWKDGELSLEGVLVAGQSKTIRNWKNTGLDLVVYVQSIDTNASPSYADVEVTFGSTTA